MQRLFLSLGILAILSACAFAQGPITSGRYQIEIIATGKVLDLRNEDKKSIQQWSNGGGRNQQWDLEDAGDGTFAIRSVEAGRVIDFSGSRSRDGFALVVAERRDSDNQKWRIAETGAGQYTIISKSGRSIESPPGKRDDGILLQAGEPHGLENQRFRLTRLGNLEARVRPRDGAPAPGPAPAVNTKNSGFTGKGQYVIQSSGTGYYLDMRRGENLIVQQSTGNGGKNQLWDIEDAGGGYFFLRNMEGNRYLDATGNRDGSAVQTRDRTGRDNQKWRIVDIGQGESLIASRNGKVLDIPTNDLREGTALQLWGEHRRENQRFRFNQVDTRETFVGGRTRPDRGSGPIRENQNIQEPYSAGRVTWRGRVDIEILLEIRGGSVIEKNVSGNSFNNGRFTFSRPMPARELELRIENKKVRGKVEIVERPSFANNFTAVIRITDPQKDAADYEFILIW